MTEVPTVIDGVYNLREKIAEGGMAVIYRAAVNLDAFDYTRLYAYTQVKGRTHSERQQQARQLADSLSGETLDRNTIRSMLKAHNIPLPPEIVAVKVAKDNMDAARFEAEWQNLLCLSHPNVIKVYGGGTFMNRQYYAMEILVGLIDPDDIARSFPLSEKLKILIEAGKGLSFLHQNGIIHRDVKPDNFLTCQLQNGQYITKITDLGIAKNIDGSPGLTQTSQMMGTPYYMPPEQVRSARDVDARADVYSLGATLYNMVLGVPPFHDKTTLFEIIASVSRGELPIPPKQHNPHLPETLDSMIHCAMAPNRDDRYDCMEDFVYDLEAFFQYASPDLLSSVHVNSLQRELLGAQTPQPGSFRFESVLQRQGTSTAASTSLPETIAPSFSSDTSSGAYASAVPAQTEQMKSSGSKAWIVIGILAGFALLLLLGLGIGGFILIKNSLDSTGSNNTSSSTSSSAGLFGQTNEINTSGSGNKGVKNRNIPPIHLISMKSNSGWMLTFQLRNHQVKEVLYRLQNQQIFQSTGHSNVMNMQTGFPRPNLTVSLPLKTTRTKLYVKLIDENDRVEGPYELLFDPGSESIKNSKNILNMTKTSWVSLRDFNGKKLVYFTHLMSYRDAIREVRYSLDAPTLELRFPMPPPDPQNRITGTSYIEVPPTTQKIYVQIQYADNTETQIESFQ